MVSTATGLKAAPLAWLFMTIGGILAGRMIYRWRKDIILTTVVCVLIAMLGIFQAVKEFVYGVAAHDSARFALKSRASMEHLFILITMGGMLRVPILPPYNSLRLLPPYVAPQISTWKRRMLREKDLTDGLA